MDGLLFILETQPHEDNRCEWTGSSFYAAVLPGRSLRTFLFFLCAATVSIGGGGVENALPSECREGLARSEKREMKKEY